eukprot:TRINITY_DN26939_c0_g1_i1.p1 TRINITY_DN26939_c0_g1~~TRINITY_DN26939_c0_g1_i1.p1  ORF type:complete len:386 (+),score=55.34 TRINITY_DN26939_c0_g1_i1:115-1272(+)
MLLEGQIRRPPLRHSPVVAASRRSTWCGRGVHKAAATSPEALSVALPILALAALSRRKTSPSGGSHGEGKPAGRSLSGASRYRSKLRAKSAAPKVGGFVDTHCHLNEIMVRRTRQWQEDKREAARAGHPEPAALPQSFDGWRNSLQGPEADLEACLNIGCTADTLDASAAFLEHEGVYGAFGIHPLAASDWNDGLEERLLDMTNHRKVVAWGECGLDYYDKASGGQLKCEETRALQREVFAKQLRIATSLRLPVVIHTRKAEEDTLEVMADNLQPGHPIHVHCFTSSAPMASELLRRYSNLCLGFTGVVTFRNAREVQQVVKETPVDRMLLETDGPYMAPEPFRGSVAHPGHVAYIATAIAKLKRLPREGVLAACRENTKRMYGI